MGSVLPALLSSIVHGKLTTMDQMEGELKRVSKKRSKYQRFYILIPHECVSLAQETGQEAIERTT